MDERYTFIFEKLKGIADLDEGRRDLGGILSRAASLTREALDVRMAYAAVAADGSSLVSSSDVECPAADTVPWGGPGTLGQATLQHRKTMSWTRGEDGNPSTHDFLDLTGAGSWLGTPIPLPDRPAGILTAVRENAEPFGDEERVFIEMVAAHTAAAIANLRTFQEVESLAVTDELTRVYNYRFLKAALRREVERASRYGQVFSILMLDVDHLKMYNEQHGHLEGSDLLRRLAGILASSSRAIDLVAKYGGDEFLAILPQTRMDGAAAMGRRICAAVADTPFTHCRPGDITVSIGVASFPQHGATMESLLAAADEALFRAKRQGRNRVETADGPGHPGRIPKVA